MKKREVSPEIKLIIQNQMAIMMILKGMLGAPHNMMSGMLVSTMEGMLERTGEFLDSIKDSKQSGSLFVSQPNCPPNQKKVKPCK